jgi:isopentenyl diphosphate isomerase/L-lactate dehydrogenase-like FMN-dependent dehydrogenase
MATTHCSFFETLQIKREDIIDKCRECDKNRSIHNFRDVCIVSNRLSYIDSKLSEMEILAQPLSLPFRIENLSPSN